MSCSRLYLILQNDIFLCDCNLKNYKKDIVKIWVQEKFFSDDWMNFWPERHKSRRCSWISWWSLDTVISTISSKIHFWYGEGEAQNRSLFNVASYHHRHQQKRGVTYSGGLHCRTLTNLLSRQNLLFCQNLGPISLDCLASDSIDFNCSVDRVAFQLAFLNLNIFLGDFSLAT